MERKLGYTLIELLVVLGITGTIAVLAFYGINNFNVNQSVSDAQRNFISDMRSLQNKASVGAEGVNYQRLTFTSSSPAQYTIGTSQIVALPAGVTMSVKTPATATRLTICLANPNLGGYLAGECDCGAGIYFACSNTSSKFTAGKVEVVFTRDSVSRTVAVEGNNMVVSRIYAQD